MNGSGSATAVNDSDQGYDPLNSYDQGQVEGGYIVREGDTLSGIAASLWGDASLWYKLAEINGLSGDESLIEGTSLMIPPGVVRSTYTAATFTPYDPNDVIGNTAPTAVKPPKGKNCGGFGAIFLSLIAIVVVAVVAPWAFGSVATAGVGGAAGTSATGLVAFFGGAGATAGSLAAIEAGVVSGAIAGAAGSIVSQTVGVATRIQDKFSWGAVGLAALGGAIGGAGVGDKLAKTAGFVGGWGQAAVAGAVNNALTQGFGVATGLQKNFDKPLREIGAMSY